MSEQHPHNHENKQPDEHRDHTPGREHEPDHERDGFPHPSVWIGSLADYNAGLLTGDWIDAAVEAEELEAAARRIVASSHQPDAEEWAIFDHDGFGEWRPGEHEQLDIVAAVARGIAEHGLAFAAWADLTEADNERLDRFDEAYLGHYDSAADWAHEVMADMGVEADLDKAIPASLRPYVQVDYETWAKDCFLGGDIFYADNPDGGVWVFDQHV